MSGSYHVTRKASIRTFVLEGDPHRIAETSDKAGVKRRERCSEIAAKLGLKSQPNRTTVAAERDLIRAVVRWRGELDVRIGA